MYLLLVYELEYSYYSRTHKQCEYELPAEEGLLEVYYGETFFIIVSRSFVLVDMFVLQEEEQFEAEVDETDQQLNSKLVVENFVELLEFEFLDLLVSKFFLFLSHVCLGTESQIHGHEADHQEHCKEIDIVDEFERFSFLHRLIIDVLLMEHQLKC